MTSRRTDVDHVPGVRSLLLFGPWSWPPMGIVVLTVSGVVAGPAGAVVGLSALLVAVLSLAALLTGRATAVLLGAVCAGATLLPAADQRF